MSARQGDAKTTPGRLVHLAVHERRLLEDARLLHLEPEVVALASALADAGEHGHATVLLRYAVDHFLDDDRLTDSGPSEHPDLSTLDVGLE